MRDSWHVLERADVGVSGTQSMCGVTRDDAGGVNKGQSTKALFGKLRSLDFIP